MRLGVGNERLSRLVEALPDDRALLLTDRSDVRWASGFAGSNGWLVARGTDRWLITDGRYLEQAAHQTVVHGLDCEIIEARTQNQMVQEVAARISGRVAVRGSAISWSLHDDLVSAGRPPEDHEPVVANCRRRKDEAEIVSISRAASIADRALTEVIDSFRGGERERDLRDELEYRMRKLGADGPSYETIVASGPINAARPHHQPTDRRLESGDSLIIDVGALVEGYHSDMTRTFFVGTPSSELTDIYRIVEEAQLAGLAAVRAGVAGVDVDTACRRVFEEAGRLDLYPHGTGHGVGLDIHEEPFFGPRCQSTLGVGEVVTVEPGLYRGGLGGVRIEDLVLVTDDGCQILTKYPKDLRCLP